MSEKVSLTAGNTVSTCFPILNYRFITTKKVLNKLLYSEVGSLSVSELVCILTFLSADVLKS